MSKRDLADIKAIETVPRADRPRPESTYAALQASHGAVARGEGANLLPWPENSTRAHVWTYSDLIQINARSRSSPQSDCGELSTTRTWISPFRPTLRLPMGSLERVRGLP
jgi:hypothetical protein